MNTHFEEIENKHLLYTYENGWQYEAWIHSHTRIVYAIHAGPLDGRVNYQSAYYLRVRPNVWQISWTEETGSVVTVCYDLEEKRVSSFIALSYGHFNEPEKAKGWKREKMDEWRELSKIDPSPSGRELLSQVAKVEEISEGRGKLPDIDPEWPTASFLLPSPRLL
ncbi:hypothetical protein JCM8547_004977 [Rhodosporidiobolus lusitaniae]